MKNWKLELFNFKSRLSFDQTDIAAVVEKHIDQVDELSEKEISKSLNEKLLKYSYDTDVRMFLEGLENEIQTMPLVYELKDLYKKVERDNQGMILRQPLKVILDCINLPDDDARMELILNELRIYDWVPAIKGFVGNLTKSPIERQNMKNSGKAQQVYTLVEKVDDGYMAFIANRWFHIGKNDIKQAIVEDYISDEEKLKEVRLLEKAIEISDIDSTQVRFKIDEHLTLGLSTKSDKTLFINEEKLDADTTLENVFNSPIVPYLRKDYYMVIKSLKENLNNLVELDIAVKVENILNPYLEAFAFNYKDKMYVYYKDLRTGNSFYEYDSVNELVRDVQRELDYDLSYFFENRLSKELKQLRTLEDKEKAVDIKIKEVNEAIDLMKEEIELLETDDQAKVMFDNMLLYRHDLYKQKNELIDQKTQYKKTTLK